MKHKEMNNVNFLKWIAKGFNPYTGEKFPNDDILRTPDVVARLFELVIELSEDKAEQTNAEENTLYIDPAVLPLINVIEPETTISKISTNIKAVIPIKVARKVLSDRIRGYLVEYGYLVQYSENKYFAMAEGKQVGIYNKDVPAQDGSAHTNVYYNVEAQKFIISKLPEIFNQP